MISLPGPVGIDECHLQGRKRGDRVRIPSPANVIFAIKCTVYIRDSGYSGNWKFERKNLRNLEHFQFFRISIYCHLQFPNSLYK